MSIWSLITVRTDKDLGFRKSDDDDNNNKKNKRKKSKTANGLRVLGGRTLLSTLHNVHDSFRIVGWCGVHFTVIFIHHKQ